MSDREFYELYVDPKGRYAGNSSPPWTRREQKKIRDAWPLWAQAAVVGWYNGQWEVIVCTASLAEALLASTYVEANHTQLLWRSK